jgi:hypothetical protein
MDSTYKQYVVPGGITYPQKVDSLKIYSGLNRVKLEWRKSIDPKVVKANIYWNNYTDSVSMSIPTDQDFVSCVIDNLPENTYTFYVKTYDSKGNSSVPVEITGVSYGNIFRSGLGQRTINETVDSNGWTVYLGNTADLNEGATGTEITYRKTDGNNATIVIPVTESVAVITDAEPDTEYTCRTMYFIKEKYMEVFYSIEETRTVTTNLTETLIPRDKFKNAALPGDFYTPSGSSTAIEKAWNGVGYATAYDNCFCLLQTTPMPFYFTIDLGSTVILNRLKIYPHSSGIYTGSFPRFFEVWGSDDPPEDGSFDNWHKIGEWEISKPSGYGEGFDVGDITNEDREWIMNGGNYHVEVTAETPDASVPVKYLRIKVINTFDTYCYSRPSDWVIIGELEFFGSVLE